MTPDEPPVTGKRPGEGAGRENIKGIFSTQSVVKVGTGSTTRRTIQKTYWFVNELEEDEIEIQPLNKNYIPSGPKRNVPKEDFLAKFNPEPEFYVSTVFPRLKELDQTIVRGEKHRAEGKNYSAEFEFGTAASVDEENVRANFGLGLVYLDRGEKTKANDIFERLVKLDAAFEQEHKHLFNDFGISLRKNGMLDQALDYYLRAVELASHDDHLFHNIARAFFEKGDIQNCVDNLKKCLEVNPEQHECKLFWKYLEDKGYIRDGRPVETPPPPPAKKAGKAKGGKKGESSGKPLKLNI